MMKSKTVIPAAYVTAGGDVAGRQRQEERKDARGLSRDAPARRGSAGADLDPLAGSLCPGAGDRRGTDDRARFPPWVVAQIDEATDGETATTTNFAMVVTLMARLGAAHGLRCVPLVMADAVTMTEALVRDKARVALPPDARIGDEAVDVPQTGGGSPLGATLQRWLNAVLRPPGTPPAAAR